MIDFIEFLLVGLSSLASKRFNYLMYSIEGIILCIIIGDLHQFIDICPIPLYPWKKLPTSQIYSPESLLSTPRISRFETPSSTSSWNLESFRTWKNQIWIFYLLGSWAIHMNSLKPFLDIDLKTLK